MDTSMETKAHELRDNVAAAASDVGARISTGLHKAADAVDDARPDATTTTPTTTTTTATKTTDTATPTVLVTGSALGGPVATHSAPTPPVADVSAGSGVHGGSHAAALLGDAVSPSEAAADLSTPEAKEAKVRVNAAAKAALSKVAGGVSAAADGIASAAETVEAKAQEVGAHADRTAAEKAGEARKVDAKADAIAEEAAVSGEAVAVKAQAKADEFAAKARGAAAAAGDKVEDAADSVRDAASKAGDKLEDAAESAKDTVTADVEVDRTASATVPAGAQLTSISDAVAATEAAEEAKKL